MRFNRYDAIAAAVALAAIALAVGVLIYERDHLPGPIPFAIGAAAITMLVGMKVWEVCRPAREARRAAGEAARFTHLGWGFPIMVHRLVGPALVRRRVEVLAFYPDGVVVKRVSASTALPPEALRADGAHALYDLPSPGPARFVPIESIEEVELHEPPTRLGSPVLTIRAPGIGEEIRFALDREVVPDCHGELAALLSDRFRYAVDPPRARRRAGVASVALQCVLVDVGVLVLAFSDAPIFGDTARAMYRRLGLAASILIYLGLMLAWNAIVVLWAWKSPDKEAGGHPDDTPTSPS